MATRQELLGQATRFITYQDIFSLALANTGLIRLSSDSNDWASAVHSVCERFAGQIPELRGISFSERPPLPPQSDEAYELIATLGMSGRVQMPNPTFPYIEMTTAKKARIKRDKAVLLDKYKNLIPEIAGILEQKLRL